MNNKDFESYLKKWYVWLDKPSLDIQHRLFSPIFNSIGYPPTSFVVFVRGGNIIILMLFRSILEIPFRFLIRFFQLLIGRALKKNLLYKIKSGGNLFQNQHEIVTNPRKNVNEITGVYSINDLNLSFLTFENIVKVGSQSDYICSFLLLNSNDIFKVFIKSCKIFLKDLFHFTKALSYERNPFGRVFDDLLKVEAFKVLYELNKNVLYVIFWENRGWQNFLAINYPQNIICVQLGYEGVVGPTNMNHVFLRKKLTSRFYFATKFHLDSCCFPNSKLATLPSCRLTIEKYFVQKNHISKKALLITSIDTNDLPEIVRCCNQNVNIFLRPHPENSIAEILEEKLDKRSLGDVLCAYDFFLFTGSSSMVLNLLAHGAPCVRLLLRDEENFDAYSQFIDTEIKIDDLSDLFLEDFLKIEKSCSYKIEDIVGKVSVLKKSDFEVV